MHSIKSTPCKLNQVPEECTLYKFCTYNKKYKFPQTVCGVCVRGRGASITGYCYNVPETWGQKGQRLCTERQGAKDLRTSRSLWYSLGMCPNERQVYMDIFELIPSYGNTGSDSRG